MFCCPTGQFLLLLEANGLHNITHRSEARPNSNRSSLTVREIMDSLWGIQHLLFCLWDYVTCWFVPVLVSYIFITLIRWLWLIFWVWPTWLIGLYKLDLSFKECISFTSIRPMKIVWTLFIRVFRYLIWVFTFCKCPFV